AIVGTLILGFPIEGLMLKMSGEVREASSHRMDRGHGGESFSANAGSSGSSVGGVLKKKKKFIAPLCSCGNQGPHCKFFAWLDDYVTCLNQSDVANTAAVVDPMKKIEEMIESFEMKIMMMEAEYQKGEKKGRSKTREQLFYSS
ncbi:hypothetical protein PIB30_063718, partial [Stylosanthes scabra]|nr:hypothetical protein [Stylosanthes scabra]